VELAWGMEQKKLGEQGIGLTGLRELEFSLLFFNTFYNLETNLNSIQIRNPNDSSHKIKSNCIHQYKIELCNGMKCNKQIFIVPKLI
jgi:hypothetical protein